MQDQIPPSHRSWRQILAPIFDIIQTFVITLTVYVLIYQFVAQPQRVVSISMEPTYYENDRLIVEKVSYYFRQPTRGDVVVFRFPDNPDVLLIKRIIGLPGETITLKQNSVYINEEMLDEPYLATPDTSFPGSFLQDEKPFTIPEDQFIVMGDNRADSGDSRIFGPIHRDTIVGVVMFRYWPLSLGLLF